MTGSISPPSSSKPSMLMPLLAMGLFTLLAAAVAGFLTLRGITLFPKPLPYIRSLPPFRLTDQDGKSVTGGNFEGKVWVADFFFSSCPGPCLQLTRRFLELQQALPADSGVQLVSLSVDPEHDHPAVLKAYAQKHGADETRWRFLTGEKGPLFKLVQEGFTLPVGDNPEPNAPLAEKVIHTTRLVLVDKHGTIRGYYDGLDNESFAQLKRDIVRVTKE